jgi:alkyl hydroperoxide reductase subunit AhpC
MKIRRKLILAAMMLLPLYRTVVLAANGATVNKPAPAFTLKASDGKSYNSTDYHGKIVVLEWLNHECPFVRKHYDTGNMQTLQRRAAAEGIVWFSINSSAAGKQGNLSPKQAQEITTSKKAAPAALLLDPDGSVGRLYGARTTPHIFVIDKSGTLRYQGAIDSIPSTDKADISIAENYVTQALESLLHDRPVLKQSTPPYGCSVKY